MSSRSSIPPTQPKTAATIAAECLAIFPNMLKEVKHAFKDDAGIPYISYTVLTSEVDTVDGHWSEAALQPVRMFLYDQTYKIEHISHIEVMPAAEWNAKHGQAYDFFELDRGPRTQVVLESPYKGDVAKNLRYLRAAMRDSILVHNEMPFASHEFYTRVLSDQDAEERTIGIEGSWVWSDNARACVVYEDLGITEGMHKSIARWVSRGIPIEYRRIGMSWDFGPSCEKRFSCEGCSRYKYDTSAQAWCSHPVDPLKAQRIPASYRGACPPWCPAKPF